MLNFTCVKKSYYDLTKGLEGKTEILISKMQFDFRKGYGTREEIILLE